MGRLPGEDEAVLQEAAQEYRQWAENEVVTSPRTVVLSGFQMAATETTRQQAGETGTEPVVDVTWDQARAACQRLGGVLPTEAQWEYTARGGSRWPWSFGGDAALLPRYAWFGEDFVKGGVHPVQQKLPNPLGLYDMHGNAWELVHDWYGAYDAGVVVDPLGPLSGQRRVAALRTLSDMGLSAKERIIFRVRPNPNPVDPIRHIDPQSPIVCPHPYCPEVVNLFEAQGRMTWIRLEQRIVLVSEGAYL